jgi:hypothetical protein
MGRTLIVAGAVLLVVGLLVQLAPNLPLLGKLPGDLRIERGGFRLYLPITTCVLVSLVVSALLQIVSRLR